MAPSLPSELAVPLDAWRAAAVALNLRPSYRDGRLSWSGRPAGHDVVIEAEPAGLDRAFVSVTVKNAAISDRIVVVPLGLALSREGRFLTGDVELDRVVVVIGDRPEVAAPWDAATRKVARHLVGALGLVVGESTARLGPAGTALATAEDAVHATLRSLFELVRGLAAPGDVGARLERIAAEDTSLGVRALYGQLLADAAPTGALGEARAREVIESVDRPASEAFDTLTRAARESPTAQIREDAIVKLLNLYPLARVEPLLLSTETLGARVRDALIAAMHREKPPFSPAPLLRLVATTPLGPASLKAAAEALGASEDASAAGRLAALCQHREELVWLAALASLLRLPLTPEQALSRLDDARRPEVYERLAEVILATRPRGGAAVLEAFLARAGGEVSERVSRARGALVILQTKPESLLVSAAALTPSAPASPAGEADEDEAKPWSGRGGQAKAPPPTDRTLPSMPPMMDDGDDAEDDGEEWGGSHG
ncbi:MAG: hypothetical protein KC635_15240 [Myxococcales bacterium]|nr:hypothetical protein [Myxococcales bacterium]MCB9735182.1 hypothetical protein [Deltaproteobacteria bacterium]